MEKLIFIKSISMKDKGPRIDDLHKNVTCEQLDYP